MSGALAKGGVGKFRYAPFASLAVLLSTTLAPFTVWVLTISPPDPLAGYYSGTVDPAGNLIGPCVLFPPPPSGGGGGLNQKSTPPGFDGFETQQGGVFTFIPANNATPAAF